MLSFHKDRLDLQFFFTRINLEHNEKNLEQVQGLNE